MTRDKIPQGLVTYFLQSSQNLPTQHHQLGTIHSTLKPTEDFFYSSHNNYHTVLFTETHMVTLCDKRKIHDYRKKQQNNDLNIQ
jgi:hypothetical protein